MFLIWIITYSSISVSYTHLDVYKGQVQTFPSNLLAGVFGFNRKGVWAIQESERITPDVKELLNS